MIVGVGVQRDLGGVSRPSSRRPRPPATSRPVDRSTATRCSTPSSRHLDARLESPDPDTCSPSTARGWRRSGDGCGVELGVIGRCEGDGRRRRRLGGARRARTTTGWSRWPPATWSTFVRSDRRPVPPPAANRARGATSARATVETAAGSEELDGAWSGRPPPRDPRASSAQGSRSRATRSAKRAASSAVIGPGAAGSARAVDRGDRLHLAGRGREERLVGLGERGRRAGRSPRRRCRGAAQSSSTSARVTPRRHPDEPGGVPHDAVVRPRTRSIRWPRTARRGCCANIASLGAVVVRERERAHVLGVGDRLEPGGGAAFVAAPRHDDDVAGARPRRDRGCGDDHRRARRPPARTRAGPRRR